MQRVIEGKWVWSAALWWWVACSLAPVRWLRPQWLCNLFSKHLVTFPLQLLWKVDRENYSVWGETKYSCFVQWVSVHLQKDAPSNFTAARACAGRKDRRWREGGSKTKRRNRNRLSFPILKMDNAWAKWSIFGSNMYSPTGLYCGQKNIKNIKRLGLNFSGYVLHLNQLYS